LADASTVDSIKEQHRDLIGVDMEVYGVYLAADLAARPRPAAFSIKAVTDFADPTKGDDHRAYASYVSASILRHFFERYALDIRTLPSSI
jgi:hypothetical protein